MKKQPDKKHNIPIWDCPHCGEKDCPISTKGPWTNPLLPKGREIYISYCSNCEMVPYDESQIKGYISIKELEAMGFTKTEEEGGENSPTKTKEVKP